MCICCLEHQVQVLAGVKGIRGTLAPSFDSKLTTTEEDGLDNTDPVQKAKGIVIKQSAIAMDVMVQCMSKINDFHCIFKACKKMWIGLPERHGTTWLSIQNHYQLMDSTSARDLRMALQKIKLKKDVNPMKILSKISVVEVRFKQALIKERKIEVVQGCTGDNYAQIIVIAGGLSRIESQRNAIALELCKAMRKSWRIKGHNNDDDKDDDIKDDSVGLEISLGTVKGKKSLVRKHKCFNCGKIGHRSAKCPHKKKKR